MHNENIEQIMAKFLEENPLEIVNPASENGLQNILDGIDLENEEIWLMQCPKNLDLSQLKQQKLKLPGRNNLTQLEVSSAQFANKKQEAFGYVHKNSYKVRLLPLTGSIVVRTKLKNNNAITAEQIENACQHAGRPMFPEHLKDRHPLFGPNYKQKLKLQKNLVKRLKEADKSSTAITQSLRNQKPEQKPTINTNIKISPLKPNKSRKRVEESVTTAVLSKRLKIKEEVAEDLKWLENV